MLRRSFVILFTLRPSDLNTTLTYVLMDNFCPCFMSTLVSLNFKIIIVIENFNVRERELSFEYRKHINKIAMLKMYCNFVNKVEKKK